MSINMKSLLLLSSVFLIVEIGASSPNVIIFLADDLGYGDLPTSGHPTSIAPNIEKLVRKGKFFTNFYSASALCTPARAALLTGMYPVRTGMWPGVLFPDSTGGLDPMYTTIAKELKQSQNYSTAIIGKWHLGVGKNGEYLPTKSGQFDYYYGLPYAHDMCPCKVCFPNDGPCLSKCHDQYVSCPLYENDKIVEQPVVFPTLTERMTKKALEFIQANAQKGFLLYYAFPQTHHPQFAGRKFYNTSLRGSFGDALMEMDDAIGQIYDSLERFDQLSNTLIFFTSDNGPSLVRHERGGTAGGLKCGKGTTYEGGMRVPFVAYWRGRIRPSVSHEVMTGLDIFPTIKNIVEDKLENSTDGFDFSQHILREKPSLRDSFLFYSPSRSKDIGPYAIRYKNYKAHFYTRGNSLSDDNNFDIDCTSYSNLTKHDPPLLFDLNLDPEERYNLTKKPEMKSIIERLKGIFLLEKNKVIWADSEIDKESDKLVEPCCRGNCQPFPTCCDCNVPLLPTVDII